MLLSNPFRLTTTLAVVPLLSACAPSFQPAAPARVAQAPSLMPQAAPHGLYVDLQTGASSSQIVGYRDKNGRPRPFCKVNGVSYADRIAVDAVGHLIVPDSFSNTITVFRGPSMCDKKLGSFKDPYGQSLDVASDNAATGRIAVANIFGNSGNGSISVCTLAHGCTKNLTNNSMVEVAGVAMSNNGDCWASAVNSKFVSTLTFFKHCSGNGVLSKGFKNKAYGGLEIDTQGNILAISWSQYSSQLYVYQGCNPRCHLIGGPYTLQRGTMTGHLNEDGTTLAFADYQRPRVDIYRYTPASLTYQYSFSDGFSGGTAAGVAFTPRSKE